MRKILTKSIFKITIANLRELSLKSRLDFFHFSNFILSFFQFLLCFFLSDRVGSVKLNQRITKVRERFEKKKKIQRNNNNHNNNKP